MLEIINFSFIAVVKEIAKNPYLYTLFVMASSFVIYQLIIIFLRLLIKHNNKIPLGRNNKRRTTIFVLTRNIIKYIFIIFIAVWILDIFGIKTTNILAGLGIAGLVTGLAFQDVLKDFLAGIFNIIDEHYAVGDTIGINGLKGEVIIMGLKTTKLLGANGEIYSFANRNITEVINYSTKNSTVNVEVTIDYNTSEPDLNTFVEGALPKLKQIKFVKSDPTFLGLDNFSETGIVIIFNIKCEPLKQIDVKRSALRIIKHELETHKIKLQPTAVSN